MANNTLSLKQLPVLITGAAGFVGKNLSARLRAEGYENLLLYDMNAPDGALESYAASAAFVFHLAGVNRPVNSEDFYTGNADLTTRLLALLSAAGGRAKLVLSSTAQAGNGSDYAKSKEAAEAAVFAYGKQSGSDVFVYRLPGVFGKWSRPSYNTVVATFCHNVARGVPLEVREADFCLPLCYIDDVVESFIAVMEGRAPGLDLGLDVSGADTLHEPAEYGLYSEQPPAPFLGIEPTYAVTLGWLASIIGSFAQSRKTLQLPNFGSDLQAKLYATYLSFLPHKEFAYPLRMNKDERGSFTEFLRTPDRGQVSVNVSKPGVTKGNHWHNTKNEKFLVVSGRGSIRFRQVGSDEIIEYDVAGEDMRVVDIPTGYTHSITNTGQSELVTVMWASETFNPERPDTYYEEV